MDLFYDLFMKIKVVVCSCQWRDRKLSDFIKKFWDR